jgi:WD40 repeat protein
VSGSGKSSLVGRFYRDCLRTEGEGAEPDSRIVIAHFLGPNGSNVRDLLHRLCHELVEWGGIHKDLPLDYDELCQVFSELLERLASGRQILILIDGIDQVDPAHGAARMTWLPEALPPSVRIILSTTPGPTLEALRLSRKPVKEIVLPPLNTDDQSEIIDGFLARYRKSLDDEQRSLLGAKEEADNPLYLLTALEELRTLGTYEEITDRIQEIPGASEPLFEWILERLERDPGFQNDGGHLVGGKLVKDFCSYLCIGRKGMLETELVELIAPADKEAGKPADSRGNLAALTALLRRYLVHRGPMLDFHHRQLREAAERRYLPDQSDRRKVHREVAIYFQRKADPNGDGSWSGTDPRGFAELPYHLTEGEQCADVERTLTDFRFLERKAAQGIIERTDSSGSRSRVYRGVALLLEDFNHVLERHPSDKLRAFAQTFRRESHVLSRRPASLWPQLANRLLWESEIDREEFDEEITRRSAPGCKPWLKTRTPLRESAALVQTLVGQSGPAGCALDPDGSFVLSSGQENTLSSWDTETGEVRAIFEGHDGDVVDCAVSPDASYVVTASLDRTLKVWDTRTTRERLTLEGHEDIVMSCAVSSDGSFIVSASQDGTLRVWDAVTGRQRAILEGHTGWVSGCAISPDDRWLVSSSHDNTLRIWDAPDWTQRAQLAGHTMPEQPPKELLAQGPLNLFLGLAVSTKIGTDQETSKGSQLALGLGLTACAVSSDGSYIVSASFDGTLKIWDVVTGEERMTLVGHGRPVTCCAVSSDGSFIVSGDIGGILKIWDAADGTDRGSLKGHSGRIAGCAISQDDGLVVSVSHDGTLKIWAVEGTQGVRASNAKGGVSDCAFSPTGSYLVVGGRCGVKICNAETGEERRTLQAQAPGKDVSACAVSPDGSFIVSACHDRTLSVWDAKSGREQFVLQGHTKKVTACDVNPTGSLVVSASADHTVKLWHSRTGEQRKTLTGHTGEVGGCKFTPDGASVVSASNAAILAFVTGDQREADYTLRVWDSETGAHRATFRSPGLPEGVLAVSPDGSFMVSSHVGGLTIWDLHTRSKRQVLQQHLVKGCAVSPDASLIGSAGGAAAGGEMVLWDVVSGAELTRLAFPVELECVAFHPHRPLAACGDRQGGIHLVDLVGIEYGALG